jgi:hypothetical protein
MYDGVKAMIEKEKELRGPKTQGNAAPVKNDAPQQNPAPV